MMASLNQSSSPSSFDSILVSVTASMIRPRSGVATEQQCGILAWINSQPYAAPFDRMALPGRQVFDGANAAPLGGGTDFDIAEMKPDFARPLLRQRDGDRNGI